MLKLAVLVTGKKEKFELFVENQTGTFNKRSKSNGFYFSYPVEFVDVDLTLFVSLCAHEHGSSDQEDVRVGVPVHVDCLQDAAIVGADLHAS